MTLSNQYLLFTHRPQEEFLLSGNIRSSRYAWMAIGARLTQSEGTLDQCFCLQVKLVLLFSCVLKCVSRESWACSTSWTFNQGVFTSERRWQELEDTQQLRGRPSVSVGSQGDGGPLAELPPLGFKRQRRVTVFPNMGPSYFPEVRNLE